MWQAGFRADAESRTGADAFTAQGDLYHGFLGSVSRVDSRVAGGNVLARWRHDFPPELLKLPRCGRRKDD